MWTSSERHRQALRRYWLLLLGAALSSLLVVLPVRRSASALDLSAVASVLSAPFSWPFGQSGAANADMESTRQVGIGTPLSLTWRDCGGPDVLGRVTRVSRSEVVVGKKTAIPIEVEVGERIEEEAVMLNATMWSQGLPLLSLAGDVCTSQNGMLHLGEMYLGKLHYSGLRCPVEPSSLRFTVQITLSPPFYAPGGFKNTLTEITARSPGRGQLFCMTLRTYDPADPDPEFEREEWFGAG